MREIKLNNISFNSYVVILIGLFFSFGVAGAVIVFILSLLGGDVTANLGHKTITGITAGIVNIFILPIVMVIVGFIMAFISYLPTKYLLKIRRGVIIRCEFDNGDE